MSEMIKVHLHDDTYLVAERDEEPFREIFVGIMRGDMWVQDLAVIRESWHIDTMVNSQGERELITMNDAGKYDVLVYANDGDEDYTDKITIQERRDVD